ncbi:MAG: hypothetical protein ACTSWC_12315 [Promethearchaeota archaeon]
MSSSSSPNKLKMECAFCHLPINFLDLSTKGPVSKQKILKCSNGHLIHRKCLEKRIIIDPSCPICGAAYSSEILQTFSQIFKNFNPTKSTNNQDNIDSISKKQYENLQQEILELENKLISVKKKEKKVKQELQNTISRRRKLEQELQTVQGKQVTLESQMDQIQHEINAFHRQIEVFENSIPEGKRLTDITAISAEVEEDVVQSQKNRKDNENKITKSTQRAGTKTIANFSNSKDSFNFLSAISEKVSQNSNIIDQSQDNSFDPGLEDDFDSLNFTELVTRRAKRQHHEEKKGSYLAFQELTEKRLKNRPGKIKHPSFIDTTDAAAVLQDSTSRKTGTNGKKSSSSFNFPQTSIKQPPKPKTNPVPKPINSVSKTITASNADIASSSKHTIPSVKPSFRQISVSTKKNTPISISKTIPSSNSAVIDEAAASKKEGPLCVICHAPINPKIHASHEVANNVNSNSSNEGDLVQCPNAHPVHRGCLKLWIVHSDLCPVCHEKYDPSVIASFNEFKQVYADQKQALKEREEMEQAQREREELLKKMDPEFTKKYNEADKLMKSGQYNEALNAFWDILDKKYFPIKDQRMLRTILNIGLIYYKLGKQAHAIKQFMKIVKIDYNYPLAFYFLGLCYDQLGAADKTKWALERALRNTQLLAQENPRYAKFIEDIEQRLQKLPI